MLWITFLYNLNPIHCAGLTFEEMAANVFVMFAAGYETSSNTSTMALYEMSKEPQTLANAVREIDQVLSRHEGLVTYQALKEMTYLDQVIYGKCFMAKTEAGG